MNRNVLLFDLDGTLLRTDKSISVRTLNILEKCRNAGTLIGISTSRSEKNSRSYLSALCPDFMIASGGALVKCQNEYVYKAEFTVEETRKMIQLARDICGADCEITIDTKDEHYWNYKLDPNQVDASWGGSIYTDFVNFSERALKMCVEIFDFATAKRLADSLPDCDCVKFVDSEWYKFTKKTATKENAILELCKVYNITTNDIWAFGDDLVDIGMLKLCGKGIAMGNALPNVKSIADVVIGSNDEDGIADYLEKELWRFEKAQMVRNFYNINQSAQKGQVVFVGSSLMEMFPIEEWTKELGENAPIVYNRGVGGYRTTDLLPILDVCVFELEPRKIFINIGTNDLSDSNIPLETVMENYDRIVTLIEDKLPNVIIYMMAYYPINYEAATEEMKPCLLIRTNEKIRSANELVAKIAAKHNQKYIDVNTALTDDQGRLKAEYTIEGMHIKPEGYRAIFDEVMKYIVE